MAYISKGVSFRQGMSQNSQYFAFVFGPVQPLLAIDIPMLAVGTVGFVFNIVLLHMARIHREASRAIDTTLIQIISSFDPRPACSWS